ncbi:MAG: putative exported protein [Cenarchaeum symbiont of Oopsacas minuta]|nr:putative exported protein [Cenarchaeum symbiont of Oopsacas minuta]
MNTLLFLLTLILFSSVQLDPIYAEISSTEKGTLDVDLVVETSKDDPFQSKLKIDFLNPITGKTQEHIDYRITVFDESENNVFGPIPFTHTSVGSVTIPIEIAQNEKHRVLIEVVGILFQPIDSETVTFVINDMATELENGGCLIATAAYGSELAPQVQQLRHTRDMILQNSDSGSTFMRLFNAIYYTFSPSIADFERENELFRETMRAYITPMIVILSIMDNADSETQIIAYGTSAILLNVIIYMALPIVVAILMHKKISKIVHTTVRHNV